VNLKYIYIEFCGIVRNSLMYLMISAFALAPALAQKANSSAIKDSTAHTAPGYLIEQPGTITFTVGVKITGKVEKPQVMIFLPKEKTLHRKPELKRSFSEEIAEPLSWTPVVK